LFCRFDLDAPATLRVAEGEGEGAAAVWGITATELKDIQSSFADLR
jgi:hypothetical protein